MKYNPLIEPDARQWLTVADAKKLELVLKYHRGTRAELPNEKLHAVVHAIIENQVALGDETPVAEAVQRLMGEELDRHMAIHAVGCVLAKYIYEIKSSKDNQARDFHSAYFDEVRVLTAQQWFDEYGENE